MSYLPVPSHRFRHIRSALLLALSLGLFGAAHGAIVYVDADLSNTVATDGTPAGDGWQAGDNNDGLWENRSFGNSASIFEAQGQNDNDDRVNIGVDHEALTTTISSLMPGATYGIYVYFWTNATNTWEIDAGLTAESLTEFTPASTTAASAGDFETAPLVVEGARTLYQGFVGVAIADAGGNIAVFIDDGDVDALAEASQFRSWYDGVGYEFLSPIPEPSTYALMLCGAVVALFLARRRK